MSNAPWTDEENDLIVADYFAMLAKDLGGKAYSKAAHNRALRDAIPRSKGSIEFKHQNISAVMQAFGEDRIIGYKPAFNFQGALEDAVARYLARNADWRDAIAPPAGLAEAGALWLDAAPTLRNTPPPNEREQMDAIARKFDVPARDDRNRRLGEAGERRVLAHERTTLIQRGRPDLAEKIRWVSKEDGDGAGYDIASFETDETPRLIEVKTTNGWERTPFYISRNELNVSERRAEHWLVMRLWNFTRKPKAFELRPPLTQHVELVATSYRADFY